MIEDRKEFILHVEGMRENKEEHVNREFSQDIPTIVVESSNKDKSKSKNEGVRIIDDDLVAIQHYILF